MKRRRYPIQKQATNRWGKPVAAVALLLIAGAALALFLTQRERLTKLFAAGNSTFTNSIVASSQNPQVSTHSGTQTNLDSKPAAATNDVNTLVEEGTELFFKGDAEGAIKKYGQALKLSPEDEEIHFNLARAYSVIGRTNEAIHYYNEALRILPEYAEAHNNLGNLLVAMHRHPEAWVKVRVPA